jgi:hypothetical protein
MEICRMTETRIKQIESDLAAFIFPEGFAYIFLFEARSQ